MKRQAINEIRQEVIDFIIKKKFVTVELTATVFHKSESWAAAILKSLFDNNQILRKTQGTGSNLHLIYYIEIIPEVLNEQDIIQSSIIQEWAKELNRKQLSESSVNHKLNTLKQFFNWAKRHDKLDFFDLINKANSK